MHALHLAAHHHPTATRELGFQLRHDTVDIARHRPEITALDVGIDINHRLDVIMIHHGHLGATFNSCQITQKLRCAHTTHDDRGALQGVDGIDFVRGCLDRDEVIHAVLRIEPVIWGCLAA